MVPVLLSSRRWLDEHALVSVGESGIGMVQRFDWSAVRDFLARRPVVPTSTTITRPVVLPVAGSPEWQRLDDDDPRKTAALIVAGSRWVLEAEIAAFDDARATQKQAAQAISEALPWSRIAKRIRDRDAWYRDHPDVKRRSA